MIIECPNCGFSGRVPPHAALSPHQARCPKCRFRFDLRGHAGPPGADRIDLRNGHHGPPSDPGDSSYELNPLVDFPADPWDGPSVELPAGLVPARVVAIGPARLPQWALRPSVWRIRLFQAWAVLFLLGAGLIGLRTAVAAVTFDDARFFSGDLLRPIAAVVLLVTAAALLCLSVDVSRRLARSTYAPLVPPPDRSPRPIVADLPRTVDD